MSELVTIARPYARSAFEIAQAKHSVEQWAEFLQVLAEVSAQPEVQQAVLDPRVSRLQFAQALVEVFGESLESDHANFIRLLVQARRLSLTRAIFSLFQDYQAQAQNMISVEVASAYPLDDEQQSRIRQALERKTNKTIKIESRVDESLLGGAIVRFGDQVIDGSIQSKLEKLSAELMH